MVYTERVEQKMMPDNDTEELRRRNHELSILNAIAQSLNKSIDLDQALHTVLAQVTDLLELHTGWVWLLRQGSGKSYLAASQNLPPALSDDPRRMEGSCYCLQTFREGDLEGAANTNVVECSRLHGLVEGTAGLLFHASIPLYAHEKQLGVMNVASPEWRPLSAADLTLLTTIGDLLGIAIERARLFSRSAQLGRIEERNRLAREIHDTLAQGLAAVSLQLESADALLDSGVDPKKVRGAIGRALELTRANLDEARRSVMDLRAAPLEGRSLAEALAQLADGVSIPVECSVGAFELTLPHQIEAGLYRIAQEALVNADRHSGASLIRLKLSANGRRVKLTVEDDGRGFDPSTVLPGRFGLIGANERANLMNGSFQLESSPRRGTRIVATIPLNR
jgi:two-component system NarL family sensor kinase